MLVWHHNLWLIAKVISQSVKSDLAHLQRVFTCRTLLLLSYSSTAQLTKEYQDAISAVRKLGRDQQGSRPLKVDRKHQQICSTIFSSYPVSWWCLCASNSECVCSSHFSFKWNSMVWKSCMVDNNFLGAGMLSIYECSPCILQVLTPLWTWYSSPSFCWYSTLISWLGMSLQLVNHNHWCPSHCRVVEEVGEVLRDRTQVTVDDLKKLTYMEQVYCCTDCMCIFLYSVCILSASV